MAVLSTPDDMLRPPINRSMKVLDRAFFKKSVPIAAARVTHNQNISKCRKELQSSGDLAFTNLSRIHSVIPDPLPELAQQGRKCLLLQDYIKADDSSTWSEVVKRLHDDQTIDLFPYELKLDYDSWDYHIFRGITALLLLERRMISVPDADLTVEDIIQSILPTDIDEIPSSFAIVGHIAHLNLREPVWPYKHLIAQVIVDKNPMIRTVINKIDDVGSENVFRTFKYEVLAGPDDMDVTVLEGNCTFKFNYAQVYWNARLQTEHQNMVRSFDEGDAVCDVMAGIGPFAVPAGRNRVFCWANDLNPNSHASMVDAVKRNKVGEYVRPFNQDGHTFIHQAAADLWRTDYTVEIKKAAPRSSGKAPETRKLTQPRTFKHYVMNLPASALEFLPDFIGLYARIEATEQVPAPTPETAPLPFVHVYCFSTKSDDNVAETKEICEKISSLLGTEMKPGDGVTEGQVLVRDVRDVAPKKRMFCASFELPREVAWRDVAR